MKRLAFKLVLFLLLGAIVNVAVAWGLWKSKPWDVLFDYAVGEEDSGRWQWHSLDAHSPGTMFIESFTDRSSPYSYSEGIRTPSWSVAAITPDSISSDHPVKFEERAYGWPMLCGFERQHLKGTATAAINEGWHPIWPGFAINTFLYAAVLWLVFAAPGMVKRRLRRVRGRCIHCGYDLRGQPPDSDKCPECGNTVKS